MQQADVSISTRAAPSCVLCGSAGEIEHEGLIDLLYGAPGTWATRRCDNDDCRLGWLDPQPDTSDIGKLYRNYWTHDKDGLAPVPDAQLSSTGKRIAKCAAATLLPWRREAFLSDSRYLAGRRPGRLLDVGCGNGMFLAGMARLGWQATGVEFDEDAVATARRNTDLRVLQGSLAQQNFSNDSFDAITLSNVIEHLPDPVETFAELKRVLAPGGRLVIVTPNVNSLGHQTFGRCWRGLEPPRHLYLFNPSALTSLAKRAGFKIEGCFTVPGSPEILESSLELWDRNPRPRSRPVLRRLKQREQLMTLVNGDSGEFVVLLATKMAA